MEPLMTPGRHFNMSILAEGVCVCGGGGMAGRLHISWLRVHATCPLTQIVSLTECVLNLSVSWPPGREKGVLSLSLCPALQVRRRAC